MAVTTIRGARIFDGDAPSSWTSVRFSSDVGLRADLVLVDGDPSRDIIQTRRIQRIWRGGTPCARSAFAGSMSEQQEIDALESQVQKVMDWVRERWPGAVLG